MILVGPRFVRSTAVGISKIAIFTCSMCVLPYPDKKNCRFAKFCVLI